MIDNYETIVRDSLNRLYAKLPTDLAGNLSGVQEGERFIFDAFGETYVIGPKGITLGLEAQNSVLGILISLYALNACSDICILSPFKAFKEFSGSMPYVGAFATHTEQLLVPHVDEIKKAKEKICETFKGVKTPDEPGGDFSFVVYPLPKIALRYIFYEADEDFPASVTCLFSNNADRFMPTDGIADVGEYTSRKILEARPVSNGTLF